MKTGRVRWGCKGCNHYSGDVRHHEYLFGFANDALIGFLIFRSTFMPRVLGALLAISGVGWMVYLAPPLANRLFFPYISSASAIGEIPVMVWLLIVGVNSQRWREQAKAGALANY